jgi:hypothetical protein
MAITLNGTTGIVTADGSVGAPSLKGTDADSGVSFAADSIKFSTGGVERMAISNSGVTGAGGGKINQIVQADMVSEGQFDTTSNSYVDITGLTVTITPSASDSKILITTNLISLLNYGSSSDIRNSAKILRGSTDLQEIADFCTYQVGGGEADYLGVAGFHQYLDSPSTTSATAYKWQIKQTHGGGTTYVQAASSMVAWEILA